MFYAYKYWGDSLCVLSSREGILDFISGLARVMQPEKRVEWRIDSARYYEKNSPPLNLTLLQNRISGDDLNIVYFT